MMTSKAKREIKRLFTEDSRDRASARLRRLGVRERWQIIGPRDAARTEQLLLILRTKPRLSGLDYYRAGIIFQHRATPDALIKAKKMAHLGSQAGHAGAQWLYAAAIDRARVIAGKPQYYGTQLFQDKSGKWHLNPVAIGVSDAERRRYNVMPLQKIKNIVELMNTESGVRRLRARKRGLTQIR